MNQLSNNGMNKAFTSLSIMTLFAFGWITTQDASTAFAQDKKATVQPAKVESTDDQAMELPGIFKVMPDQAANLTQKSLKPVIVKRNSDAQFTADNNKGIFGVNLKRAEKRAALAIAR